MCNLQATEQLVQLSEATQQLHNQLEQSTQDLQQRDSSSAALQEQLDEAQSSLAALAAESEQAITALQGQVSDLEQQLAGAEARMQAAAEQHAAQGAEAARQLQTSRDENTAVVQSLNDVTEQLAAETDAHRAAKADIQLLRERLVQLQEELSTLRGDLEDAGEGATDLHGLLTGRAAEIAALKQRLSIATDVTATLRDQLSPTQQQLHSLQEQYSALDMEYAAIQKAWESVRFTDQCRSHLLLCTAAADQEVVCTWHC